VSREGGIRVGGAMKPEGLAMSRTRRPAKPGRGADTAAPSRHQATHRHAGFVVARQRQRTYIAIKFVSDYTSRLKLWAGYQSDTDKHWPKCSFWPS